MTGRLIIALLLGIILGVPFALTAGRSSHATPANAQKLIIISPHVPQIREEFGRAFEAWHLREHGTPVTVDWRAIGGTSEIRKQLDALFSSSTKSLIERGLLDPAQPDTLALPPGSIEYDLFFGGGSFDHTQVANPMSIAVDLPDGSSATVKLRQSAPADFTEQELVAIFGENRIGPQTLYNPDQRWIGTALSSFGIVYNRDVFARLGMDPPDSFVDLTDPRLIGQVALADPRQSGSITTTFDSILGNQGWDEGWRTLRGMCGTTRYFTNSSTKPPIDVSMGEAAVGLAIDFYGRGQAQVIQDTGGGDRVGYTDPAGAVYVDADPISLLNGAPNPDLAKRFIRFCLTEEAQALWQFRAGDPANPVGPSGSPMGPARHELRRMPVRRVMYEKYLPAFVDQVNPFSIVSDIQNPGWRTGVQVMMGCFGVDLADECRAAYAALDQARRSGRFTEAQLAELDALFYAFPETDIQTLTALPGYAALSEPGKAFLTAESIRTLPQLRDKARFAPDDATVAELQAFAATSHSLPFTQATFSTVRNEWRTREKALKIEYTRFFRENYRQIVQQVEAR